ncbi:MAG: hypothetical protein WAK53_18800 [Chromatiaceae bacterium]
MQRLPIFRLAVLPLLGAGAVLFSAAALADGATNDTIACYKWDQFPDERLNLGVRNGGPLSFAEEAGPAQRTHGVHAKHVGVCGSGTNGAVEGAVVVAATTGAHMGLHTMVSRGAEEGNRDICRPVFLDCYSDEASLVPETWTCQARNEFGAYHGVSTLTLVAIDTAPDDPVCGVFEDKDTYESSNKGRRQVAASGTVQPRGSR